MNRPLSNADRESRNCDRNISTECNNYHYNTHKKLFISVPLQLAWHVVEYLTLKYHNVFITNQFLLNQNKYYNIYNLLSTTTSSSLVQYLARKSVTSGATRSGLVKCTWCLPSTWCSSKYAFPSRNTCNASS